MCRRISFLITVLAAAVTFSLFVSAAGDGQITYLSDSMTADIGDNVTLSCEAVEVSDSNVLYVWYSSDEDGENGTPVTSPTENGDYTPETLYPGEYHYYCMVYYMYEDSSNLIKSDVVTLNVINPVSVDRPDVEIDIEERYEVIKGEELSITYKCVSSSDECSLVYQWYAEDPETGVFNKVVNANTDTLVVNTDRVGTIKYFCIVNAVYEGSYSPNRTSVTTKITVTGHDHSFGEYKETIPPTCTDKGKEERYCSSCDASEERVINATGHKFSKWNTVTAATESKEGSESRSCSDCGETETRTIPKLEKTDTTVVADDTTVVSETTENTVTEVIHDTTVLTTEYIGSEDDITDDKREYDSGFPWWVAIMLFGMFSATAFAAISGYSFGRSKTLSAIASKYMSIKNNNGKN
ncbi:MAG: hypothetical protein IKT70_10500 [Clostridia bacterium]|nr:hypothetical protein [Clostridia bacterium]